MKSKDFKSQRIQSQQLKNILPETVKKKLIASLKNQLDYCACLYYFAEILKSPSVYTYEKEFGADKRSKKTHVLAMAYRAVKDLGLKDNLSSAYIKIKEIIKQNGKSHLDERKFFAEGLYKISQCTNDFKEVLSDSVVVVYLYKGSITKRQLSILEKDIDKGLLDMVETMSIMEAKIKCIEDLLKYAKNIVPTKLGDVFYNGKLHRHSKLGSISKNLEKSVSNFIDHSVMTSEYIYNYSSVIDVPIIISPLVQMHYEGAFVSNGIRIINVVLVRKKKAVVSVTVKSELVSTSYISLTPIVALRDSIAAISHTLIHEGTHVWQFSTERKYPKRYKRFYNDWTRYFNELSRLQYDMTGRKSNVITIQQRENFLDGLSDYITIKKKKKYYDLKILESGFVYRLPSINAVSNTVLSLIVPSAYSLTEPYELMAETMGFLGIGEESNLGIGLDSDVPSFFVPAKRLIKLTKKYNLDR